MYKNSSGFIQTLLIIVVIVVVFIAGASLLAKKTAPPSSTGSQQMMGDTLTQDENDLDKTDIDSPIDNGLTQIDADTATF